jgi:hypothetical protein
MFGTSRKNSELYGIINIKIISTLGNRFRKTFLKVGKLNGKRPLGRPGCGW